MKKTISFCLVCILSLNLNAQTDAGLEFHQWALTPPMGWNSWDCYGPSVVESQVKANADYMAEHLKPYGWEYVVVDIRWFVQNQTGFYYNQTNPIYNCDEYGRYLPATNRFPSSVDNKGFASLADYVHGKGLKFGIHIMRGIPKTAVREKLPIKGTTGLTAADIYSTEGQCSWLQDNYTIVADKPGAQEYYNSIFELYASWGVDFIKIDDLSRPYHQGEIELIRKAIDRTGRPIVLSMSPGETPPEKAKHAQNHANMWRTVDDLWDNWNQLAYQFEICNKWAPFISPGAWPDADMLPLGHIDLNADSRMTKFTENEQYTLMTLFTMFKSPLMFGGNLPDNDVFTLSLLTNEEVLDMHKRSIHNKQWFRKNETIAWAADDPDNGDKFLALFFPGDRLVNTAKAIANSQLVSRTVRKEGVYLEADITNAQKLYLVVTDAGDNFNYDHADWINPTLFKSDGTETKLTALNWVKASCGWDAVKVNKSLDNHPLTVNGTVYDNGYGVNSYSTIEFDLPEGYTKFTAFCGVDDEVLNAPSGVSVEFMVFTEDPSIDEETARNIPVDLTELGFSGAVKVRDMWNKQDIGTFSGNAFSPAIKYHGAGLYRLSGEYTPTQTLSAQITIDPSHTFQTIVGFSASDCWTGNYVGQYWNETPKNTIAKFLFSRNLKADGSPEGIGLSMWRVNLGAGTLEQGDASDIEDISRRAECFLDSDGNYVWTKQAGQQWLLQKAKEYGCKNFVAFSNAPLVRYSRNGKGYSNGDGKANLQADKYDAFADYMTTVIGHFKQEGIEFKYISPVNEPQWDWKDPSQEGSPWQNDEIKKLVVELDKSLQKKELDTKILIAEAGEWKSLYESGNRAANQIYRFFDRRSSDYIGDLPSLAPVIGGHSYWSHDTNTRLRNTRLDVKTNAKKYDLDVFQTEWSMLSGGEGIPSPDEASYMDIALFMAKIIHGDLAFADVSSWSYWTSMDVERWNHKNRFLLIALSPGNPPNAYNPITQSGTVSDRSTLWALGNYSFFVRPGYQRIKLEGAEDLNGLMGTAYIAPDRSKIAAVYVNMAYEAKKITTKLLNLPDRKAVKNKLYITNSGYNLRKYGSASSEGYDPEKEIAIPSRSVATIVYELEPTTGIIVPEREPVRIYPNPAHSSGKITVKFSENENNNLILSVYSSQGNLVYAANKNKSKTEETISLPTMQCGVYFLKIQRGDAVYHNKLLVN